MYIEIKKEGSGMKRREFFHSNLSTSLVHFHVEVIERRERWLTVTATGYLEGT
jgi:hypothetical protein